MALGNPHQVESEVMHMLLKLDAESLLCAYGIIELEVPESKKGSQHLLFKNLVRHPDSEEVEAREDGGLQYFQRLCGFLSKHFKIPGKTKGEPLVSEPRLFVDVKQPFYSKEFINGTKEHETKTENFVHHPLNNSEMFCLQKLKDFKISCNIGRSGEKDKLSYTSLAYQIQNGRKAGYNDNEISLIQIMRSQFSEKDSPSKFTEMSNSVQSVNESTYDFAVKLMSKWEKVLILAKEEDCPYDEKLVQRRFLHAISTGIRNNNICNDLRHVLQNVDISDEHLLELVSEAIVYNSERNE